MPLENCPILVGCGRLTQRDVEPTEALGPLGLMETTAREAAEDSGAGARLLESIDHLCIVQFLTGVYDDPCALLSERLNLATREGIVSGTGGNTPQPWRLGDIVNSSPIVSVRPVRATMLTTQTAVTVPFARDTLIAVR